MGLDNVPQGVAAVMPVANCLPCGTLLPHVESALVVGTSTKQRLQSVRTEFVVLPQVVVAVYASGTPPYCLPCGTTSLHTVWVLVCVAVQHSAIVHVTAAHVCVGLCTGNGLTQ